MTTHDLNEVNRLKATLPEIKAAIAQLNGGMIASLNVRKFNHKSCDYDDSKIDLVIPRGKIKDLYLGILKDKLNYNQDKIDKIMNPEIVVNVLVEHE